jgi:hypothetical protein
MSDSFRTIVHISGNKAKWFSEKGRMVAVMHANKLWESVTTAVPGLPAETAAVLSSRAGSVASSGSSVASSSSSSSSGSSVASAAEVDKALADASSHAYAYIMLCVNSDEDAHLLRNCPVGNAFVAWSTLLNKYEKCDPIHVHLLQAQLMSARQASSESIATFLSRIHGLNASLHSMGTTTSEMTLITIFMMGLQSRYSPLRMHIRQLGAAATLDGVLTSAQALEADFELAETGSTALYAGVRRRPAKPTADTTCYRCNTKGHTSTTCTNLPQKCGACGNFGHHADRCKAGEVANSSALSAVLSHTTGNRRAGTREENSF